MKTKHCALNILAAAALLATPLLTSAQPVPIAHWSFDAATLTIEDGNIVGVTDLTGTRNLSVGTAVGGAGGTANTSQPIPASASSTGKFGEGLTLTGNNTSGHILTFPNFTELMRANGAPSYTVSMWIKTTAAVEHGYRIFSDWGNIGSGNRFVYSFGFRVNGQMHAQTRTIAVGSTGNGSDIFARTVPAGSAPGINTGEWHMLTWTFDTATGNLRSYINGALVDNFTSTQALGFQMLDGSSPRGIFGLKGDSSNFINGEVAFDEVWVFQGVLDEDQVGQLYDGNSLDPTLAPPRIVDITPDDRAVFRPTTGGISFTATTVTPNTLAPGDVTVLLNGVDISSSLNITPMSPATELNVTYSTPLGANQFYTVEATVQDNHERTTSRTWAFDTIVENSVRFIEAEDFNFDGGGFINNPQPTADFQGPNSYYGQGYLLGVAGVDFNELNPQTRPTTAEWRHFSEASPLPQTTVTTDSALRQKYDGAPMPDFDLLNILSNEWVNYTRDFTAGGVRVYLRARSTANQSVELHRVTSNPAQPDQTTVHVGNFAISSGPYGYTQLRTVTGDDLVLSLSGVQTLRLLALNANNNLNMNYLMLVPTTDPVTVIGPIVDSTTPTSGAVNTRRDRIEATIENRETLLAPATVSLFVNEVNVTSSVTVTPTESGATIVYNASPALEAGVEQTVRITYQDTLGNSFEHSWTFTTSSDVQAPELSMARGGINAEGQLRLRVRFSEAVDETSAVNPANYSIAGVTITGVETAGRPDEITISGTGASLGQNLTLTAGNVEDAVGNPMAPNSTISFVVGVWVPNFSFEVPVQTVGTGESTSASNMGTGWTVIFEGGSTNNYGVANPATAHFGQVNPLPAPFEGNQVGFINLNQTNSIGRADSEVLGTLQAQNYTLRIAVGARAGGNYNIHYSIGLVTAGGVELGTFATNNLVSGAGGTTTIQEMTYVLTESEAAAVAGQQFFIRIRAVRNSTGFSQATFDDVRLNLGLPAVILEIENPTVTGDTVSFAFATQTGQSYRVEYRTSLTEGTWQTLTTIVGDGTVQTVNDSTAAAPQRFYRVVIE